MVKIRGRFIKWLCGVFSDQTTQIPFSPSGVRRLDPLYSTFGVSLSSTFGASLFEILPALAAAVIRGDNHSDCLDSDWAENSAENRGGNDVNCEQGRYQVPLWIRGAFSQGDHAGGDIGNGKGNDPSGEAPKMPLGAAKWDGQTQDGAPTWIATVVGRDGSHILAHFPPG